jgi:hypothetical protein
MIHDGEYEIELAILCFWTEKEKIDIGYNKKLSDRIRRDRFIFK